MKKFAAREMEFTGRMMENLASQSTMAHTRMKKAENSAMMLARNEDSSDTRCSMDMSTAR